MLNDKLISSAYEDRRSRKSTGTMWWEHATEGNHVTPRAWASAGWKIASLDVDAQWVRLARIG
jgi:hypothetical protein